MATTTRHTAEQKSGGRTPASPGNKEQGSQDTTSQLRGAFDQATAAAQETGQNVAARAKENARSYFNDKRDAVAGTMNHFVEATRQVAHTLRDRDDARVADYTESLANQVEQLVHYVESLEPAKVIRELEGVARRQPLLFYGGLFVAGMAISRFLMASERSHHGNGDYNDQFNVDYGDQFKVANRKGFPTSPGPRGDVHAGRPAL
jgi:hypothetical protein